MQVFYTKDDGALWSLAIRHVAAGQWAHCGLLFTLTRDELESIANGGIVWEDGSNPDVELDAKRILADYPTSSDGCYRVYYESIIDKDVETGKTGVRGPRPFMVLAEWVDGNPKRRAMGVQDVLAGDPNHKAIALRAMGEAAKAVKKIKYSPIQIIYNWAGYRLHMGMPTGRRSEDRWTCVEMCVRLLPGWFAVECLRLGEMLYDEYAPSSSRDLNNGLWELMEKANVLYGRQCVK